MKTIVQLDKLINTVANLLSENSSMLRIIAIDGYYGAGKTTFARNLSAAFETLGHQSQVLHTDEFMRYSRRDRERPRERYLNHPGWYDLERLASLINALHADPKSVSLYEGLYNHATGELDLNREIDLRNTKNVILEGDYAFHGRWSQLINLGVILKASHDIMLDRVIFRDKIERGIEEEVVRNRYWIINGGKYHDYLEARILAADLVIDTSKGEIVMVESNTSLGRRIVSRCFAKK